MLLVQQRRADGHQRNADGSDQLVQAAHHLAFYHPVAVGLSFGGQLGGVAFSSHAGQPRHAVPGGQKAAGAQLVPGRFGDGLCLAGQQAFVGLGGAVQHHGVGGDLLTRAELDHIILHKLVGEQLHPLAVPQAVYLVGGDKGQFVNGLFGAQLLDDADEGVPEHDAQKAHVQPRADEEQHQRQHKEHEVKIGTDIVPHDLPGGFGGGLGRGVDLPCCAAAFHLRRSQAVNGHTKVLLLQVCF